MITDTGETRRLVSFDCEMPVNESLRPGHTACAGCGAVISVRMALKAMGSDVAVIMPSGCMIFPLMIGKLPSFMGPLPAHASFAAGLKHGLEVIGNDHTQVIAFSGDGGTFDIGLQALSGAVERDDDFIFFCYDNEAYMNTGIQRCSSTPLGAWTGNVISKPTPKKDIMAMMAGQGIKYAATVSIAYPSDFLRKLTKARTIKGTRFFHVLACCPTGWRYDPEFTVELARWAVQSRVDPLYEIERGEYTTLQVSPGKVGVSDYLKAQKRFAHLSDEEIVQINENVDHAWERLLRVSANVESLPY